MSSLEIKNLQDNDLEYRDIVTKNVESYKCEWKDAVHDSYLSYVKLIQGYSKEIHDIKCEIEDVVNGFESLNIDALKNQSKELCREADSI